VRIEENERKKIIKTERGKAETNSLSLYDDVK
jgi:hypothetical protein